MADKKISELTSLTGAEVEDAFDTIAIVDDSAGQTKKISREELFKSVSAVDVDGDITVSGTVDGRNVSADGTKLDGIEANADVTDSTNVAAAGALMNTGGTITGPLTVSRNADNMLVFDNTGASNDWTVKVVDPDDTLRFTWGTADLYSLNPSASLLSSTSLVTLGNGDDRYLRKAGGTVGPLAVAGNIVLTGTVDGREVSEDGAKLDGIEAGADVTDAANVEAAGAVMAAGSTMSGDLTFGDNDKAIFGAGNDLQIYHDGSNTYIDESAGVGNLIIKGANVQFRTPTNEAYLDLGNNGAVTAYYDNAAKLATTSTGVDVTGTVTADGLTLNKGSDGSDIVSLTGASSGRYLNIQSFENSGAAGAGYDLNATSGQGAIRLSTVNLPRLLVENNGDISFYEDTGTTPKFFWDASAEGLAVGQTSLLNNGTISAKGDGKQAFTAIVSNNANSLFQGFNSSSSVVFQVTGNGNVQHAATLYPFTDAAVDLGTSAARYRHLYLSGTVTADGLVHTGDTDTYIKFLTDRVYSDVGGTRLLDLQTGTSELNSTGSVEFNTGASLLKRLGISSNGDISFYEDTGTTAEMVWDASGEALTFGDNVKAVFGAGSDLQIYHDGANSRIQDAGTGNLLIRANAAVQIENTNGDNMLFANAGGSVDLYHNANKKLETTSSGIDVTGTVAASSAVEVGGNEVWHAGNDGSGSGLDADLLDGQHGSYYYAASNPDSFTSEESGTFTPVIRDAATGGNVGSASNVEGHYYKVGKLVFIRFSLLDIDTTGMTGSNTLYITGLPFVAEDTTNSTRAGGNLLASNVTFSDQLGLTVNDSQDYVRLQAMNSGAGWSYIRVNDLSSGVSDIWATLTYQTA